MADTTQPERATGPEDEGFSAATEPRPVSTAGGTSVLRSLGDLPRVHLREPGDGPPTPIVRPRSTEMPADGDPPDRYQMLGEIARGGMGAILKGRDVDLGRDIAVKVLLEAHQGRAELLQRFVEEAQISGQLQHPGIVPVYELGQFGDSRPYFTMKLVKGQTLARLLEGRGSPRDDLAQFLKAFEQVCQTLAYAHSRGVIHRDLKPSNVMVGAFGEVQVMDWGLAKVLAEGGVADEQRTKVRAEVSVIRTRRSEEGDTGGSGSQTEAGSILGTPAYMAPEQARGDLELVDERADVFGLGAILCEILSGKPPFTGHGAEAQRKAQTAYLVDAHARLDACGADPELIALARLCLAAEPWDRPRDAGAVASKISGYHESVADRLRRTEMERAAAEVRALEERKRRKLTAVLAATALMFLMAAGGGAAWWWQDRASTIRDVESALAEAEKQQKAGHWPEVRAALERAEGRLGTRSHEALRVRVAEARRDAVMVAELDDIRLHPAMMSSPGATRDEVLASRAKVTALYSAAFARFGLPPETPAEEAARRVRESPIREELVVALDHWRRSPRTQLGFGFKKAEEAWTVTALDPGGPIAEDGRLKVGDRIVGVGRGPDSPIVHVREKNAGAYGKQGTVMRLRVMPASGGEAVVYEIPLGGKLGKWLEDLVASTDDNPWRRRLREALASGDRAKLKAMAGEPEVLDQPPPVLSWIGHILHGVNLKEEEWAFLRRAQRRHPGDFWLNYELGGVWINDNRAALFADEALAYSRAAVALRPISAAYNHIGIALYDKRAWDDAIAEYRRALEIEPDNVAVHNSLGNALDQKGDRDTAIEQYRKVIGLAPNDSLGHGNLARTLQRKGKTEEAIPEYRRSIELAPRDAKLHHSLGTAFIGLGDYPSAIAAYRRALEIDPKYTQVEYDLFDALVASGTAVAEYRKAIERDPKSAAAHKDLGRALWKDGDYDGAIDATRKAIELDPTLAEAHNYLANSLNAKGDPDGAEAEYRLVLRLEPNNAKYHSNLGTVLMPKGDLDGAKAEFEAAIKIDPKNQTALNNLVNVEKHIAHDRQLPALLRGELKPRPEEIVEFAELCAEPWKGHYATAVRLMRDAFQAGPGLAEDLNKGFRYDAACRAARAGCRPGKEDPPPDEAARAHFRDQALAWLREDLAGYRKLAASGKLNDKALAAQRWRYARTDLDLAGVRDESALDKLPPEERGRWKQFWADVEDFAKTVQDKGR